MDKIILQFPYSAIVRASIFAKQVPLQLLITSLKVWFGKGIIVASGPLNRHQQVFLILVNEWESGIRTIKRISGFFTTKERKRIW